MKSDRGFSKDFLLVVIGQIISLFGNQILRYALPLYLLNQTGSSALFGTISACAFIPMIVLFPVGGIIADRVNKRNIMVMLDFATAALIVLFYVMAGTVDIVPLMAVTMMVLYGIQGAYQPAVKASVPILVDTGHLMQANSLIDVISSLANMAGPVIGGILFSVVGLMPILYVSTGCFLVSAIMEIFIHIPFEKKQAGGNIFVTGFGDLKESFQFMFQRQPVLWKISFVYAFQNLFLSSLVLIGVPVIITQHLGFPINTANRLYGYAQGVIAAGSIAGGLLAGILSKKLKPKTIPALITGAAVAMLLGGNCPAVFKDTDKGVAASGHRLRPDADAVVAVSDTDYVICADSDAKWHDWQSYILRDLCLYVRKSRRRIYLRNRIREDRRPRISSVLCSGGDCDGNWCSDTRNFQGSGPENGVWKAAICE